MVTGIDLIAEQLRIAGGEPISVRQEDIQMNGHAMQRPRPASRRPIERPGEPLDVEPIERRSPPDHESQPLDDPW